MPISLAKRACIAPFILLVAAPLAASGALRVELHGHGVLVLQPPDGWQADVLRPESDLPPTIALAPRGGPLADARITTLWSTTHAPEYVAPAALRAAVERARDAVAPQAAAPGSEIFEIKSEHVAGYAFSATDAHAAPGEPTELTQGEVAVGDIVLVLTVTESDPARPAARAVLEMVKGATIEAAPAPSENAPAAASAPAPASPAARASASVTPPRVSHASMGFSFATPDGWELVDDPEHADRVNMVHRASKAQLVIYGGPAHGDLAKETNMLSFSAARLGADGWKPQPDVAYRLGSAKARLIEGTRALADGQTHEWFVACVRGKNAVRLWMLTKGAHAGIGSSAMQRISSSWEWTGR